MKFIYTLFLISLFFQFSCSPQVKNDLSKQKLIGNVRSLTESHYTAIEKFGKIENSKLYYAQIFKYNDIGNMIEHDEYKEDGSLDDKIIYKYDGKDKKIEDDRYADDTLQWKSTYTYDTKGNEIESKIYNTNGDLTSTSAPYKYDERGNKIVSNYQDEKYTSKYDNNNNEVETNRYYKDTILVNKFTYKYDTKGNKIEHNIFNADGSLFERITFAYDNKQNVIEEDRYNIDEVLTKKTIYTYEYDKIDNWIKKIIIEDNKPTYIIERHIEYK